jgi:hypothetical protein
VSAKNRINTTLARLTGHHLAKGAPGERIAELERQLQHARTGRAKPRAAKAGQSGGQNEAGQPANSAGREPRSGVPGDIDDAAKAIIEAVRPFTMTSNEKLYGLISAVRYVVRYGIPGDIVECGVWRGGSMQAAARTFLEVGDLSRELYLFDTFEGMSEPTEFDVRRDGTPAAELMRTKDKSSWLWAVASLDDVKSGFEQIPYPAENVHYVVGKVEDTIPAGLPEQIAILRLDTDWYESTKHELDTAYSRLSPGGVLIIDDYGHWAGSKKATDDFVDSLDEPLLLHRLSQGRIAVKPFPGRGSGA